MARGALVVLALASLLVPGRAGAQEEEPGATPAPVAAAQPDDQAQWYYLEGDQEVGPVTASEIRRAFEQGKLTAESRVRRRGPYNWAPLEEQEAFLELTGWHYAVDGGRKGPVAEAVVRRLVADGTLSGASLIWRPGMAEWTPLSSVARFRKAAKGGERGAVSITTPPPPPTAGQGAGAAASDDKPPPKRKVARYVRHFNRRLFIPGAIIFGVTWGGSVAVSILGGLIDHDSDSESSDAFGDFAETLWIPVVGPIIADQVNDPDAATRTALMVMLSLGQATGAALLIAGMVGKKVPIYEPVEKATGLSNLAVTPLVGRVNGVGVSAFW